MVVDFKALTNIKPNWQKILIGILMVGNFALGFIITYLSLKMSKVSVKTPTSNSFAQSSPKPINEANPEKGIYNVLLLGYGGGGHDGSMLTDSIIVVHVDTNSKKVSFISVPRDLWIPGGRKVNAEGSINGFQNVGSMITSITGLPINYYVSVDFGGFVKIIDDLGGITVQVPATFDDAFYPIKGEENNVCGKTEDEIFQLKNKYSGFDLEKQFTCRYEHLHFDEGPTNLDGTTAMKFVRSRHGDSDFGRSLRQIAVLSGIGNKLISFQIANKFNSIVDTLSRIVRTDLDGGTIKSLISVLGDPKAYSTKQIQLTTDNVLNQSKSNDGQFILVPRSGNFDFSEIKNYIKTNLN
jgi:anionic cell wall polymer biosynthesis LytR-Cps2A-Psr (LCP) family protein